MPKIHKEHRFLKEEIGTIPATSSEVKIVILDLEANKDKKHKD